MSKYIPTQRGFGIVEIVIGTAILSLVYISLYSFFYSASKMARQTSEVTQVGFLLDEGIEVVKLLRDEGWTANIAPQIVGNEYVLNFSAMKWEITTGEDIIDSIYYRTVIFNDVYRDINDDIAVAGALDPGTKKLSVEVEWWNGKTTSTESVSTYITDIFGN